ncbi:TRADD-N-associated membrane domain-containing protein [Desulfosediminicola sp.]|uniref:TRADD-N-associated membrane domain-containing protein n=1 Tax=Desulfosediminicola sp. TaxID=2886825 RepID=UPI003AF237E3
MQQDITKKRDENEADREFAKRDDINFLDEGDLKDYYTKIKKQLNILFYINVGFCSLAAITVLIGIYLTIFKKSIEAGSIVIISGLLCELLGNIFIKQYKETFNNVSSEYFKLLLCNNMNKAYNEAKKLPVVDIRNNELRYLEMREILRAIMKNFNEHLATKK